MSLHDYLAFFHSAVGKIDDYGFADTIDINVEIRASKQVAIKVIIILVDQSILQIREYIDAKYKIEKIGYAYQYQDEKGQLIFRYDNARHKPDLGFMEHKHQNDGSIIQCDVPNITDVVDEVIENL